MRGVLEVTAWSLGVCATGLSACDRGGSTAQQGISSTGSTRWEAPSAHAALSRIGPGRMQEDALARNAECVRCHADVAASWRRSRHASAFTDATFQRAFSVESREECVRCHAPEARLASSKEALAAPVDERAALGVACVTCHVVNGDILAAPRRASRPDEDTALPHPVERVGAFASTAACAGCHEFPFPSGDPRLTEELSQSTVREHDAAQIEASCADCHMPEEDGEGRRFRSHALASVRDPSAWRRALRISAKREGDAIRVSIGLRDVGHALPTGDMLRRLRVRAEVMGVDDQLLSATEAFVGRAFSDIRDRRCRRETRDNRPRPGSPSELVLRTPGADEHAVGITVRLERVLFGALDEPGSIVDSSYEVFRAILPAKEDSR
ncbi:MAG: multiheme c-type cytochrome [Polyangiaceae bacterium]